MEIMQQLAAAATATALCPEPSLMAMTTAGADGGRHRDAAWQEATPPRGLRQPRPPLAHPPPLPLVRPRLPPLLPPVLHPRPLQLAAGPPGFPPRGPRRRREPWRGRPGTGRGRSDGSGGGGDGPSVYGAAGQGEEPAEAPACASMDATRLSSNAAGKRAGVGQDGFVRPGGMAVPAAAAKMAPPSKVQVKEEPVDSDMRTGLRYSREISSKSAGSRRLLSKPQSPKSKPCHAAVSVTTADAFPQAAVLAGLP
ncbi:hypothetical protein [Oryza sativa Japonica Group]|uniref:Uncharacterized protein n=1 Tax=Oryza sativa subsp. japonica TaxID=39947 RepID=Q5ZEK3_ORYSJ|nr:hypothetical protein [Oryza sativa Japonica Group]BAD68093.1 hypothetical protein [Oryza sativa Japonica Group]